MANLMLSVMGAFGIRVGFAATLLHGYANPLKRSYEGKRRRVYCVRC